MNEYSQITFDFFTPPSTTVKKNVHGEKPAELDQTPTEAPVLVETPADEDVVEVIFPEQVAVQNDDTDIAEPITPEVIDAISPVASTLVTKSTRGRKSLKSLAASADLLNIPEDEILFQKQYYSIGEVGEMFQVNASLLRFWESEFDIIQPRKNRKGDRHFRPIDIKNLQLIHDLLRRRKLTIEGAKDFLKRSSKAKERFEAIQNLRKIRSFLAELKGSL